MPPPFRAVSSTSHSATLSTTRSLPTRRFGLKNPTSDPPGFDPRVEETAMERRDPSEAEAKVAAERTGRCDDDDGDGSGGSVATALA